MEVVSHLNKLQLVPLSYWESRQIDLLIDRLFILTTITGYHNLWVRYKSDSLYFALCLMNKSFAECVCVYVPVVMRVCLNAQTVGFPLESFPQHLTTSSSFWGGGPLISFLLACSQQMGGWQQPLRWWAPSVSPAGSRKSGKF